MKQQFSNMEVVITSDRPMYEGSIAAGTGILRRLKKQFLFDARTPKTRKTNPKVYHGKWLTARWSGCRNKFRITCELTKEEVILLQQATQEKNLTAELKAAIKKLVEYAA